MEHCAAVVLAAGKGKRMMSEQAKVLHRLCGKPMLFYVLNLLTELKPSRTVVVVGTQKDMVINEFRDWGVVFVEQGELLGTGDAVLQAEPALKDSDSDVLVLAGDTPLLSPDTIVCMLRAHCEHHADVTLLSAHVEDPFGYGRIVRRDGGVSKIVEEKDATAEEKGIREINAGVYLFNKEMLFRNLRRLRPDNKQHEYYLTDVVRMTQKEKGKVQALLSGNALETIGINDRATLARVEGIMRERLLKQHTGRGVTFTDPGSVAIDYGIVIGRDTVVHPFVSLTGRSAIGKGCTLHAQSAIHDARLGNNVTVGEYCSIVGAQVPDNTEISAFSKVGDEEKKGG
jgi:bifunctional UDP-N-acetylglucosamine pyrophosphorylase/glucosamine-1-phosphate N-acetyltransferase